MKKVLMLAVLAVGFLAAPAFASVQNIKISGDVNSTWVSRDQFDLGAINNNSGSLADRNYYQNFIATQSRLRADADLTDNVQATVSIINERAWGDDNTDTSTTGTQTDSIGGANDIDIYLAYVTLREMLYSPLTVIIGRQVFAYGNSFVINATGPNNATSSGGLDGVAEDLTERSAVDGVRMQFDYNPLTVDVVASKLSQGNLGGKGAQDDDVDLFGTNANWQAGDAWNSVVEGYFWAKIDQSTKVTSAAGGRIGSGLKADTVYMPGVHVSTNPIKGLNLQGEVALQRGNKAATTSTLDGRDNIKREAMGAQAIANYMLPFESTAKWSPVFTGVYTFVSGDNDAGASGTPSNDDRYTAWDPMLENQGGGTIYNTLFSLTNARIITGRAAIKPIEDVTTTLEWNGIWLDKELKDGAFTGNCTSCLTINQPDGSTQLVRTTTNTKLGNEFGAGVVYDYTEDVQFGAKYSVFLPGALFEEENNETASQYLVNANVKF